MNIVSSSTSISIPFTTDELLARFEPFVDEHVIARFLNIASRRVLEMARKGEIPAHPIGRTRKTWRFRIGEVDECVSALKKPSRATMAAAVPGTHGRKVN